MGLFSGKVVWITGAGTGIGRAGALMFAGEGATVALMGRRRAQLDEVAAEIAAKGGRAVVAPLDVADRPEVDRVARELIAELERVDILVNNAGLNVLGDGRRMENLTPEDFDLVAAGQSHRAVQPVPRRVRADARPAGRAHHQRHLDGGEESVGGGRPRVSDLEVRDDGLRRLARQGGVEVRHPHLQHLPGRDEYADHAEAAGEVLATRSSRGSCSPRTSPTR